MKRSDKWLPRKPAAPVINTLFTELWFCGTSEGKNAPWFLWFWIKNSKLFECSGRCNGGEDFLLCPKVRHLRSIAKIENRYFGKRNIWKAYQADNQPGSPRFGLNFSLPANSNLSLKSILYDVRPHLQCSAAFFFRVFVYVLVFPAVAEVTLVSVKAHDSAFV